LKYLKLKLIPNTLKYIVCRLFDFTVASDKKNNAAPSVKLVAFLLKMVLENKTNTNNKKEKKKCVRSYILHENLIKNSV